MICASCHKQVRYWRQAHVPGARPLAGDLRISVRGALAVGDMVSPRAIYCRRCAPLVRFCRRCGCTDHARCNDSRGAAGVCMWVAADLCSACWWANREIAAALSPGSPVRISALAGLTIPGVSLSGAL